ncbi:uncharacterized protein LOC119744458 [Patiria miniata]|uniref:Uncharacterized protein n=1 Tax=Patiria miniata TaxID=46514 RepID=A0A914BJ66_PATMI|nr:uncharacterized protein LOC119744458 [Patiria miniata]
MAGFVSDLNSGTLLWCVVSLVFLTSVATDTCPDSCRCHGNSLKCTPDVNGGTRLLKVPPDLLRYNMFHIKYANLSRNELQQIEPGDFYGLPRVIRLDLRHNRLRALLRNGFSGLEDLTKLELSYNIIRYIDRFAFEGLPNVHKIDLSNNEIAFLEDDSFNTKNGLGSLLSLDLSFNKIHDLDGRTFLGLESLRELYLNHNAMRYIRTDVFTPFENLELIYLGGNFINCTCDWLKVFDNLQSRDIEIMDTSDALRTCTDNALTCDTELEPGDYSDEDTDIQRVATNLTLEDLRPPETDRHGNIVSADGNSFPPWSVEGERVLSTHDAEMRRRIGEVEDRDRRRVFTVVFQERMRGFLKRMMDRGNWLTTTARATTGGNSEEYTVVQITNITKHSENNVTNTTLHPSDAKMDKVVADARIVIKDVLQLLFPPGGFFNASEISRKAPIGPSGIPDPVRVILGQVAEARRAVAELKQRRAALSTPKPSALAPTTSSKSGHTTTRSVHPLTMGTRLPQSALSRPEIEIPFFAVIGIFVFVCIAAGAIAMFSGLCRDKAQCCQCSCLSAISEKLTMRKQQIERQSRKTTAAKSDFIKMHCLAKHTTDSSVKSTSPDKMPTQLAADEHGVVSVTPLVLTDEFPDESGTTPPKSQPGQRKTSTGLLGYIKNRLSSTNKDAALKEAPETSPRDEITLFDISVHGSTSEPLKSTTGTRDARDERDGLPVRSTDARAEKPKLPANQTAESKTPVGASFLACDTTKENVDEKPLASAIESDDKIDVKETSSDLRWYARECLSNQRMMTQARTQSMTSSNGQTVKKGDSEEDGIW